MKDMSQDVSQMDIRKYLQIINRRKYLFIIVSMICLSIIFWGSFFMPKVFEAKSTVFIERNIMKNLVEGIVVTPSLEDSLRVLTYEMMSRSMLLKVTSALDLDVKAKNKDEIESIIRNFQQATRITIKGDDLFVVSYRGKDPKLVRDYVNALISKYIEENTSSKREEAFSANQFLSEQIAYYKKKLEDAEDTLVKFRLEKGIYFSSDEKTIVSSIQENRKISGEAELKIDELEAKKRNLSDTLAGKRPVSKGSLGGEKNILRQRLSQLERVMPLLLLKNTENHPDVITAKAEIESIRKQLEVLNQNQNIAGNTGGDSDIGNMLSSSDPVYQQLQEELLLAESEIDSLKAKVSSLNSQSNRIENEFKNIPEEKKILAGLERDRNTYDGIYNQLLNRLGQAEVSKQMEIEDKGTSFRIVDSAILPTRPVSPDRVIIILFGIAGGLAAGVGAVFAFEYFDSSIKEVDTLKAYLGLPVIAVIPKIVTEKDIEKTRRFDRKIYAGSAAYLLVIGGIFIRELISKFS
jgi:polysaccharide chain length determinant protein (PEP-CTERM system associated)